MTNPPTDTLISEFAENQAFLLRLARKLAQDEHSADDLVQRAWLAALEHPPRGGGGVRSWLARVLRNLALNESRNDERRQQREVDVARFDSQSQDMDHEARLERQQEVMRAVLALREPYRRTIVARYADGLTPTEIAQRHGIPLATVKARLARGISILREDLDRRFGEARALWLAPLLGGPDAGLVPIPLSPWALTGNWIMGKKVIVAGIAVVGLLGLGAFLAQGALRSRDSPIELDRSAATPMSTGTTSVWLPIARTRSVESPSAAREPEEAADALPQLHGVVIDGRTRLPIAGARIALHPQREMSFTQLMREFPEDLRQLGSGVVLTHVESFDLPAVIPPSSILGRENITVGAPPLAGAAPLVEVTSDDSGEFVLEHSSDCFVLVVTRGGFGTRTIAISERLESLRIELWSAELLEGQVIDADGKPFIESIELYFEHSALGDRHGGWKVTTRTDGTFQCQLPAATVQARSLNPDWAVTGIGKHPVDGTWVFRTSFDPGKEKGPVVIPVTRLSRTTLRIVDDESGEPVQEFWLLVHDETRRSIRDCGYFYRQTGTFELAGDPSSYLNNLHQQSYLEETRGSATVWTARHAAATVPFENLLGGEQIEVRLRRGDTLGVVRGRVVDGNRPLEGVELFLRPFRHIDGHLSDHRMLDHAVTDATGTFELHGPPGAFSIQVNYEGESLEERMEIPGAGELTIDVSRVSALELTLHDTNGKPRADIPVTVNTSDERQSSGRTDANGVVLIGSLEAGPATIYIAHQPYTGSWRVDEVREIELNRGQTLHEAWVIPAIASPIHPQIILEDAGPESNFDGWRVRSTTGRNRDWISVAEDGTVPIDIQSGKRTLIVQGDHGRKWRHEIDKRPEHGYTIRLRLGGVGYEGILRNRKSGNPYRGIRVFAAPFGDEVAGHSTVSTLTDREGRFSLTGLTANSYSLSFNKNGTSDFREQGPNPLSVVFFHPNQPPAAPPVALDLALPEKRGGVFEDFEYVRFKGRLLNATTGAAEPLGMAQMASLYPLQDGLMILYGSGWQHADDEGGYEQEVPRAPRYRATCGPQGFQSEPYTLEWDAGSEGEEVIRDLTFGGE